MLTLSGIVLFEVIAVIAASSEFCVVNLQIHSSDFKALLLSADRIFGQFC